ncbi:MAG: ribonuclease BN [Acidobacteriales bacterium 59-55]|nr:YihY/virulence factor BrkB family protein [Terriglobales bacterium]ODU54958.1 MAG: ribonuclease BN [Granulicella sp. SCN 62-9]OJV41800.1 MAG: ribonuclease BN [Acidobacteriales bacterium 59-55]
MASTVPEKTVPPKTAEPGAAPEAAKNELPPKPIEEVRPVVPRSGFWPQIVALAHYLMRTEVHTYAFSVAANSILSLFPFIVLLLTVCRRVFHSRSMESVVSEMMKGFLPTGQDFVMRNMQLLAHPHERTEIFSLVMLLITSTGVFLPLEVALNNVWGVKQNRSYLRNQAVSLGLALTVGVLAMASVAFTTAQATVLPWLFFGHTQNEVFHFFTLFFMQICAGIASIMLFFLIYWVLPNRKIPARAVLPTAIVTGLLWEGAKHLYMRALPWLDFQAVYGPFYISVGLMMWAFLSGLLLLAGAHFSATRYALWTARQEARQQAEQEAQEKKA